MTSAKLTRSDSWTPDNDAILTETVLRYIREGSTQLKAFEECGEILGRTAAACGFRWNGMLRKQYIDQINDAKSQKRQVVLSKKERHRSVREVAPNGYIVIDAIIRALRRREIEYLNLVERTNQLEQQVLDLEEKVILNIIKRSDVMELLNQAKQIYENEKRAERISTDQQRDLA